MGDEVSLDQHLDQVLTQIARLIAQIETREKNAQRMERSIKTARVSPMTFYMVANLKIFSGQLGASPRKTRCEYWEEIFCSLRS